MTEAFRAALVLALAAAVPVRGDERRDAIQKVYGAFKDAVVVVSCQLRASDDPAGPAQPQRIPGVIVDRKGGLVMVSALAFPDQVPLSRYDHVRVLTVPGAEDEGYPARVLGRGHNAYAAFVRVADPARLPELPDLSFEDAEVALGDELLMLAPTDQRAQRTFALGTCNLEMDSPRGWGVTIAAPYGCPAFTLEGKEGKAVGVVAGRTVGGQVQPFVVGAKELLSAIQNPPVPQDQPAGTANKPRGWTGLLYVQGVGSRDLAEDFGLPETSGGMIVGNLIEDSPAGKAGLKVGDVILGFQGTELKRSDRAEAEFLDRLQRLGVDEKVPMEIWRDGKRLPLEMVTAPLPKVAAQAKREVLQTFGFVAREMVLDDRYLAKLAPDEAGVICDSVTPAAWASDAGMLAGDVIKKVNDQEVRDLDGFREAFKKVEEEKPDLVFFTVLRGGRTTLTLRMEPRW